jgi:hypothetical protein
MPRGCCGLLRSVPGLLLDFFGIVAELLQTVAVCRGLLLFQGRRVLVHSVVDSCGLLRGC